MNVQEQLFIYLKFHGNIYIHIFIFKCRAPDNFLKQGVANASLGAKGVFLQNPVVFPLPSFYTRASLEVIQS